MYIRVADSEVDMVERWGRAQSGTSDFHVPLAQLIILLPPPFKQDTLNCEPLTRIIVLCGTI